MNILFLSKNYLATFGLATIYLANPIILPVASNCKLANNLTQIFITTHHNLPLTLVNSDALGRAHVPNKSAANKYEITLSNVV